MTRCQGPWSATRTAGVASDARVTAESVGVEPWSGQSPGKKDGLADRCPGRVDVSGLELPWFHEIDETGPH